MADKVTIPYNDVFFYGLSLRSKEASDIKLDIFANILMRYLRTLKPVSSRLYRSTGTNKYEYSYSFIPSKPLNWRVIKNRRIVEEIEHLSDGKYCLNYYDDQGNDVKRVHFNNQHKWTKTNYYNTIYGDNLICSIVPKELNGQTVILMYPTGATYPVTYHCCPKPSCDEVLSRVFLRCPEPEISALTNYGVLYFADEETLNIYNQVLSEEEAKYAEENKPASYTTDEDVAGGFCFDADSFDSTKNSGSIFDLSEAEELTDEGFSSQVSPLAESEQSEEVSADSDAETLEDDTALSGINNSVPTEPYSLESELANAIKLITESTDVHIDENIVFADSEIEETEKEDSSASTMDSPLEDHSEEVAESNDIYQMAIDPVCEPEEAINKNDDVPADINESSDVSEAESETESEAEIENSTEELSFDNDNLLAMGDEDIDDYVRSLIDSLLLSAKEASSEYTLYSEDGFVEGATEAAVESDNISSLSGESYIALNTPDATIESNGAEYFYYGETDPEGKRSGYGRTLMSDGKTAYEGEYLSDKRHGEGSFYYKNGTLCYWGNWKENLRNGFGLGISSETGLIHTGTWKNNKPTGIGVRFDSEGKFMYIDSACERANGGIRITGFTENAFTVEFWDEKSLKVIKKEISVEDLLK